MPHSDPMEAHSREKIQKIEEILHEEADFTPFNIDLKLNANAQHVHHRAELHLKTAHFDLHTHEECPDMYVAIDSAIDKMVELAKKERDKRRDKNRHKSGPKGDFGSDKYTLGD